MKVPNRRTGVDAKQVSIGGNHPATAATAKRVVRGCRLATKQHGSNSRTKGREIWRSADYHSL